MKKFLGIAGIALIVALTVSALGAATASAGLPEFVGFKVGEHITGTSGAGKLKTLAGHEVTCTEDHFKGEITNNKSIANATLLFLGCKNPATGVSCQTSGDATGKITTKTLDGRLVYDSKKINALVLLLPTSQPFAAFGCGTETLTVRGSVLVLVGNINKAVTTNTFIAKILTNGAQEFESANDEGTALSNVFTETEDKGLFPFAFEMSAIEGTDTTTTETAIEIKA